MSQEESLRRRLELLKAKFDEGEIVIADHLAKEFSASIEAVRYDAEGKIDLDTVDGRIRSMALAVDHLDYRKRATETNSLIDIQSAYFNSIELNFGEIFGKMLKAGSDPHRWAFHLSRDERNVEYLHGVVSELVGAIAEFWEAHLDTVQFHLQDLKVTKGVFGGDLFPSYDKNIASTCGLYLDTIVLTDPFMNSRQLFSRWGKQESVRYFIKHAMNVLLYKDLALADLDPPLVVIVPFESSINDDHREMVERWAAPNAIEHAKKVFGRDFADVPDLMAFGASLNTIDKVVAAVAAPERMIFDVDWEGPFDKKINRALSDFQAVSGSRNPGQLAVAQCFGRMMQANDLLAKSNALGGTPLIDAPTSWRYFNWKLEYDASEDEQSVPLHMLHGLQRAGQTDVEWLGSIPSSALIEMRREGALQEIRSVLTDGIVEIAEARPNNFFRTTDRIVDNINAAFDKHQANLNEVRDKKLKFWGRDIGSWFVTGSIGVTAAITSNPVLGIAALAADQVLNAPKLREIPAKFREVQKGAQELRKSPMGLFFAHKK